jgi:hypothetical protein
MSKIAPYNAWELEALVSATNGANGAINFYNNTAATEIPGTETLFSNATVTLTRAPFNEGLTNIFDAAAEGHDYQAKLRCLTNCTTGSVGVYKAGLWLTLIDLTKAEIPYRISHLSSLAGPAYIENARTRVDLTAYSNAAVLYSSDMAAPNGGTATIELATDTTNDFGQTTLAGVTNSILNFDSAVAVRQNLKTSIATPLTFTSGFRLIPYINSVGGITKENSSFLMIRVNP